jgi:hypothetical protein
MSKRIQKSSDVPTFTYQFAPDENGNVDWVEMKTSIRLGDRDAINSNMFKLEQKKNPETGELEYTGGMKLDTSLANVAALTRLIVKWGGDGFMTDGKLDEITLENVSGLSEDDSRELLAAINARNPKAIGPKAPAEPATPATATSSS